MKRILAMLFILMIVSVSVFADTGISHRDHTLRLSDSGTTTVASGISTFEIITTKEPSGVSEVFIGRYNDAAAVVQINGASGITISEGHLGTDITTGSNSNSGTTFSVVYFESALNTEDAWDAAYANGGTTVFNGVLFSGNTMTQQVIYPEALGYIRFRFITGITTIGAAEFIFRIFD